ncbi:MAG TPA: Crp/Fnr family transcriptional regulator [Candidatus Sulfotelmatobacter sp.]|nr:Crp/Fnr family transcriptional regulator [Candidatus Sulfotelmatobacter sp.]
MSQRTPGPAEGSRNALMKERVEAAVHSLPVLQGLAREDQSRIARLATLRDFERGEWIWRAGDASEQLTLIVHGRVKIVRHAEQDDVILEIFGEGEPVGAIAVYNGFPYPASAAALEPTTLLCIPRREYFELLDRHPEVARAVIRELTRLNLSLTRKLEESRSQRVDVRIAQLFLTLAERMGRESADGVEVPLELTRHEIAQLVGTTVETAIRVMSRWGREGLLLTGEGRFVIPSLERLEEAARGSADAT